jgi:hypothetical protein
MGICRRDFAKWMLAGIPARLVASVNHPKLLVLVVLEQVRGNALEELSSQFGPNGLRKILYKSAQFADCRNAASTFSSSSLATLATGAWPAQHGIVADSWLERGGVTNASSEVLIATTLASMMEKVHVIGMNATQAAMFAGSSRARLYWRNPRGQFATLGEPPGWLVTFNTANPIDAMHNVKWMALDAKPGAPPLRTLTFDPDHPQEFFLLYQGSPFGQDAQFDLLETLIEQEKLGTHEWTDVVVLINGASAVLGYETGSEHPLMQQLWLQLDRRMEALLTKLGHAPGDANFNLVLVGAHGAPPAPDESKRARMAVDGERLAQMVDKTLAAANQGRVRRYLYPFLYLDLPPGRDPELFRIAAGRAAMEHPAVAGFYTAGGMCSTHSAWEARYRNSFNARRSGDVMLSYRPEYVEDFGLGRGISYGSLYNYDVQVPLYFYGPQFRTGVFDTPVESIDVAPTIARLVGVDVPSSTTGRVLSEAFAA